MPNNKVVFGDIPGVLLHQSFSSFAEMNVAKVHRYPQAGIAYESGGCADSIVVSGKYEDDEDFGDVIVYTGQGGRDEGTGNQIADQKFERGNKALLLNRIEGVPVRVIRGRNPKYTGAPVTSNYRYDGLFNVTEHWCEHGKSGFLVCRYRFEKLTLEKDNTAPLVASSTAALPLGNNPTPSRNYANVQRIIRDTKIAKQVKSLYKSKCQICGLQLITPGGPYAEAAHIRSLGRPHNGSDTSDNIICLCPNHHVMFDYYIFSIKEDFSLIGIEGRLNLHDSHILNKDYLKYHRELFENSNSSPS
jgi:putative restriction endonuclease